MLTRHVSCERSSAPVPSCYMLPPCLGVLVVLSCCRVVVFRFAIISLGERELDASLCCRSKTHRQRLSHFIVAIIDVIDFFYYNNDNNSPSPSSSSYYSYYYYK